MDAREIMDDKTLARWLDDRPRADAVAIAFRAAARVVPLWSRAMDDDFSKFARLSSLTNWRLLLTLSVAAVSPDTTVDAAALAAHDIATDEISSAWAANRDGEFDMLIRSGVNVDEYVAAGEAYREASHRQYLARQAGDEAAAAAANIVIESRSKILSAIYRFAPATYIVDLNEWTAEIAVEVARDSAVHAAGCARHAARDAIQTILSGSVGSSARYPHRVASTPASAASTVVNFCALGAGFIVQFAIAKLAVSKSVFDAARSEARAQSDSVMWSQIRKDAEALLDDEDLFTRPLWSIPQPNWFSATDAEGRAIQAKDAAAWTFWNRWWGSVIAGDPLDLDLQKQVALIPDDDWQYGPAHLAKIIAALEGVSPAANLQLDCRE